MKRYFLFCLCIAVAGCLTTARQNCYADQESELKSVSAYDREEVARGFVVFDGPAFPVVGRDWLPSAQQRQQPLRLTLAAGETGSGSRWEIPVNFVTFPRDTSC